MSRSNVLHFLILFITRTIHLGLSVSYNPKVALAGGVIVLAYIDILFVCELLVYSWPLFALDIAFSIILVYGFCMPRLTSATGN